MEVFIISKLGTKSYSNISSVQVLASDGWLNILPGHSDLIADYSGDLIRLDGKDINIGSSSGVLRVSNNNIYLIH